MLLINISTVAYVTTEISALITNWWSGRGLTLKILRRTTQCDDGLEELKPVDQNLQYDFNYQQFTYLPEEVTVYPVSGYECANKSTLWERQRGGVREKVEKERSIKIPH